MTTLTIDTYRISQKLLAKGYTKEQAEGFIDVIQDINLNEVSTKGDIESLKSDILKWIIPLIFGLYGLIIFKIH